MQLLTDYKTHLVYKKQCFLGSCKNILNDDDNDNSIYDFDLYFNTDCYFNDLNIFHSEIELFTRNFYLKRDTVDKCMFFDVNNHKFLKKLNNHKTLMILDFTEAVEKAVEIAYNTSIDYAKQLKNHFGHNFEPTEYFKNHINCSVDKIC